MFFPPCINHQELATHILNLRFLLSEHNSHFYCLFTDAGGGYKNNLSRQLLEAGMPDIPEFPFKDASSLAPLLMNNNHNNTSMFSLDVMLLHMH